MKTKYPIAYRDMAGANEFRSIPVGSKIWFKGEKQGYTVRASNVAFAVLTKPFNARKTVLYTIIDWESGVRGAANLIFGVECTTDDDCQDVLKRLTEGDIEVSGRNYVDLDIIKFQRVGDKKVYRL